MYFLKISDTTHSSVKRIYKCRIVIKYSTGSSVIKYEFILENAGFTFITDCHHFHKWKDSGNLTSLNLRFLSQYIILNKNGFLFNGQKKNGKEFRLLTFQIEINGRELFKYWNINNLHGVFIPQNRLIKNPFKISPTHEPLNSNFLPSSPSCSMSGKEKSAGS